MVMSNSCTKRGKKTTIKNGHVYIWKKTKLKTNTECHWSAKKVELGAMLSASGSAILFTYNLVTLPMRLAGYKCVKYQVCHYFDDAH